MTKERFISIHLKRGYTVENMGRIVKISMDDFSALWFFNEDGSLDENHKPSWKMTH